MDAQQPSARPPDSGICPHQYSRAASAAASLLAAGLSPATALQDGQLAVPPPGPPAAGAAVQTGRQQRPAGAATQAAAAGPSVKPGMASPSSILQVEVVPESPEVGSEEGSPFTAAAVTVAALVASSEPANGDAMPTAISFQQARRHSLVTHSVQPSAAADDAQPPALGPAGGMATTGGTAGARAGPSAETTPQPKRVQGRPAPTASRLSRGSGVQRSPPGETVAVTVVAAALQPAAAAMEPDGPPVQGAWHLGRDGASGAERHAAAPAAQTPPACLEAPGPVAAPGVMLSSDAQHPLPAGNGMAEAAASLTLRLSEPDEHSTPVLAGSAAHRALQSAAGPVVPGAQNMTGLHTQAPSPAHQGTPLAVASAEHTPEPAAQLDLMPMAHPPLSGDPNPEPSP